MNGNTSYILSGADAYFPVPTDSLGKQFLRSLRKRNQDDVFNIDLATGKVLTCGKLIEDSVKLATALKILGLKQGDAICFISENNIHYCVVILAALYIGVATCLLNPDYTINELRHGFQFSNGKVILCSSSVTEKALILKEENICLSHVIPMIDEVDETLKNLTYYIETTSVDVVRFQPDEVDLSETGALIFLSSGTTGLPKGVLLTHQNLIETVSYLGDPRYAIISPGDILLTVLPFFHLLGAMVQLVTLAMPVRTIFMNKFKPDTFLSAIEEHQPSKLIVVPPIVLFMTKSPLVDDYNISCVKECISAGASIAKTVLSEAKQRFSSMTVRSMYGLTETAGFVVINVPHQKDESVGILVPRIMAKVRNPETHQCLGPNEVGEFCFKGSMIMKGYVQNINATQGAIDKDGFFCTGDIGYYDQDGYFYIVGRIKEIIKYKGFQVSPTELEQLLLSHSNIKDCGVIGIPDEKAGELPFAFIVRKNDQLLTEEEIVRYVAERISINKRLYGGVKFLDQIPKNPSGKILRAKLKELLNN